ncbi:hypothetical protein [Paenibacillus harenae]|uniref:Uncharacterized protein n=1 Tax=Paenibacillus harenae TaxID=306543 RepID=A0ABT9TX89_PAEHA|nr:hypothetical protein [Paenibacillus harenae]MDQ0110649.1 hypothetical protein [Paenibacillus harenae]
MNAVIASSKYAAEARFAADNGEISYEKIGRFNREQFIEHCITVGSLPIQVLYADIHSVEDEPVFAEGLELFKSMRSQSQIVVIAIQRSAVEPAIAQLARLGCEIRTASSITEEPAATGEDEDKLTGAINRLTSALSQPVVMDSPDALVMDLPDVPAQEKVVVQQKIIGSVIIAVTSVEPKSGSTHLSIQIANYLSDIGKTVAVIEANDSGDYARIEQIYEGVQGYQGQGRSFGIKNVEYYKRVRRNELASLLSTRYDYVVLDMGYTEDAAWLEELERADVQLVLCAGAEWRQHAYQAFAKRHRKMDQSRWIHAVPMADELSVSDIKKLTSSHHTVQLPCHPDPYKKQKDSYAALEAVLRPFIGDKKKAMPKGLVPVAFTACILIIIALITLLLIQ